MIPSIVVGDFIGLPESFEEISGHLAADAYVMMLEVGERVVEKLKSHTSERRPPARRGGADRFAHPGHWADVTGQLVADYRYEVIKKGRKGLSELHIINDDSGGYGAILEEREGFFVLRGIDERGGLIDQEMRAAIAEYMSDVRVVNG